MRQNKTRIAIVLVMAGWGMYVLLLPFISPVMENLFPVLWQCQYKRITGQQCPFCGITRDIEAFYSTGKLGELNRDSSIYFIMLMSIVIVGVIAGITFILLAKIQDKKPEKDSG